MKRVVQIWIEPIIDSGDYVLLELFNDENIEVTSTVQNINDIAKTFTDFSQSFTVPASPQNNAIFQHFYNSDVNSTIDHNLRRRAYIEINLTPFRTGKISLEKSNIKKGRVENYQITFYGDLRTLKDIFAEDKLSDVKDVNSYSHEYTAAEIENRITDDTIQYDVRYPLISPTRLWQYGTGAGTEDITQNAHAISYTELFPALSLYALFGAFESYYGIRFSGAWVTDERFKKCFLLYKNAINKTFISDAYPIEFDYTTDTSGEYFTLYGDSNLNLHYITAEDIGVSGTSFFTANHGVSVTITTAAGNQWFLDTYSNGSYLNTVSGTGSGSSLIITRTNEQGLYETLTFKLRGTGASLNYDVQIDYLINWSYVISGVGYTGSGSVYATTPTITLAGLIDLSTLAPEIKVADLFSAILKEFNLTCYGVGNKEFIVEPLDNWYNKGAIVDITQYTDVDSIDVDRIKLFKKIAFKYQESESFMNKQFKGLYFREYGNTELAYNYDGDEYSIEVPFENLLHNKFTGTNLQVGYHLNESYNGYIPKPTLLYMYEKQSCSFKFDTGTGHNTITEYLPFGQDLLYNNINYSLNFSADVSTLLGVPISQSLFGTYYFGYLTNLYNLKNRLVSLKAVLPISLLTNLQLNDRLIIRDKRYIINDMKTNLTTGEVNFTLYLDFRPLTAAQISSGRSNEAQCITYFIDMPNGAYRGDLSSDLDSVTFSSETITQDTNVEICIPANETGEQRTIIITIVFTFNDGTQITSYIYIIQEA